jgi:uncharacterized membrane protein (DUF4010 family)
LPLAGFLAGFASSTAAVAGFGQRARAERGHTAAAAAGALFANLGSLSLFAGVIGAGAPSLLRHAALPLGAGALVLLLLGLAGVLRQEGLRSLPEGGRAQAFHIGHALLLVGIMALLLLVSAFLQRQFGSTGVIAAATAVALVEVHAAAASLAQLSAQQQLELSLAVWGLVLLVLAASAAKSVLAFVSGGAAYGWRVAAGLMAVPLAMSLVLLFVPYTP